MLDKIKETTNYIKNIIDEQPQIGIILGTGLGALVNEIDIKLTIPYEELPNFPVSTVESHSGKLIFGDLGGKNVVVMQGRFHYYEGYDMRQVAFPIQVIRALGARSVILTSAVGGMNPHLDLGDIVVITDHINMMGDNPLIGPNDDRIGPRFPDMSEPYHRSYIGRIERTALDAKIPLKRAVLVAVAGPNLETAAEYRFLRLIGADVVGMSMVPETIAAVHGGMKVLGLSVVTDKALPDCLEPVDIASIVATAKKGGAKLTALISEFLKRA